MSGQGFDSKKLSREEEILFAQQNAERWIKILRVTLASRRTDADASEIRIYETLKKDRIIG
jgi:hypothetical protein